MCVITSLVYLPIRCSCKRFFTHPNIPSPTTLHWEQVKKAWTKSKIFSFRMTDTRNWGTWPSVTTNLATPSVFVVIQICGTNYRAAEATASGFSILALCIRWLQICRQTTVNQQIFISRISGTTWSFNIPILGRREYKQLLTIVSIPVC